ncbi:MAG: phosphate/phosphite/phosphonate ABC transporter substrate-binding protein [Coriobacteriia bacterium]|nr:phosphate/phosphite/phosphonate ABC transporter substrate-binding protein [Coriobacteriia bacterium]
MHKHSLLKAIVAIMVMAVMVASLIGCSSKTTGNSNTSSTTSGGKITVVWYPNESAADFAPARDAIAKYIKQATGKDVVNMTTTDYTVAIEAIDSGKAQIAYMGAQGYVQAHEQNSAVLPLFTYSGPSGTLSDALYYSRLCVNAADASQYESNGTYSIQNIAGKKISFVSQSSTSGWAIPTSAIIGNFKKDPKWSNLVVNDLAQGGPNKLFSTVLFGNSHQGAAVNLLTGKCDVAAFDDDDLTPYVQLDSGTANTPGAVYEIAKGASAPFDTLTGKKFTVIGAYPVLNEPFVYNSKSLSSSDADKILNVMTSDTVSNDTLIFDPNGKGLLSKTKDEHFIKVTDEWYQPIRDLGV